MIRHELWSLKDGENYGVSFFVSYSSNIYFVLCNWSYNWPINGSKNLFCKL